ncbi:hypothetical protein GS415_02740 [Rhodococcus hoagii]|nr:hypothetical protein [Prescottella equi]
MRSSRMALTSVALGSSRSSSALRSAALPTRWRPVTARRTVAVARWSARRARSPMYRVGYSVVCVTPTAWI